LTIVTGDRSGFERFATRAQTRLEESIGYSRALEEALGPLLEDLHEKRDGVIDLDSIDRFKVYMDAVMTNSSWQHLNGLHPANLSGFVHAKAFSPDELHDPTVRFMLATFPLGQDEGRAGLNKSKRVFQQEQQYRVECACRLFTRYHFWAISHYFREAGRMCRKWLHPWVEVHASSYHMLGLFAANSLRHARQIEAPLGFLRQTSSQLIGREVLHTQPTRQHQALRAYLNALPALHCLVCQDLAPEGEEDRN
jgi:hypothetical protein